MPFNSKQGFACVASTAYEPVKLDCLHVATTQPTFTLLPSCRQACADPARVVGAEGEAAGDPHNHRRLLSAESEQDHEHENEHEHGSGEPNELHEAAEAASVVDEHSLEELQTSGKSGVCPCSGAPACFGPLALG